MPPTRGGFAPQRRPSEDFSFQPMSPKLPPSFQHLIRHQNSVFRDVRHYMLGFCNLIFAKSADYVFFDNPYSVSIKSLPYAESHVLFFGKESISEGDHARKILKEEQSIRAC